MKTFRKAILTALLISSGSAFFSCANNNTPVHQHTYSETLSSDKTGHWYAATCEHNTEKKDFAEHVSSGPATLTSAEICIICGYKITAEKGVTLTLDPDGGTISKTTVTLSKDGDFSIETPEKEGLFFEGWYDEEGNKVETVPEKDMTLKASWAEAICIFNTDIKDNIAYIEMSFLENYMDDNLFIEILKTETETETWAGVGFFWEGDVGSFWTKDKLYQTYNYKVSEFFELFENSPEKGRDGDSFKFNAFNGETHYRARAYLYKKNLSVVNTDSPWAGPDFIVQSDWKSLNIEFADIPEDCWFRINSNIFKEEQDWGMENYTVLQTINSRIVSADIAEKVAELKKVSGDDSAKCLDIMLQFGDKVPYSAKILKVTVTKLDDSTEEIAIPEPSWGYKILQLPE